MISRNAHRYTFEGAMAGQADLDPRDLDRAEMVSQRTGLMGSTSLPTDGQLVPPYLYLDGDEIVWFWKDPPGNREAPRLAKSRRMLEEFVRIQDGRDALRFAQEYGVLGICAHGLPASHNPPLFFPVVGLEESCCYPVGLTEGVAREPVARWLRFARQADALMRIRMALHREEPGNPADWSIAFEDIKGFHDVAKSKRDKDRKEKLSHDWANLVMLSNHWLELGHMRPAFTRLDKPGPSVRLRGGGYAFGELALQLAMSLSSAHDLAVCSECFHTYTPERKPRADRPNYCPTCGPDAANRNRQKRYRERENKNPRRP